MARKETVKIKSDAHPSGYITVNKEDAHKYEQEKPKAHTKRVKSSARDE